MRVTDLAGQAGGGVLEAFGQAFGAFGGLVFKARGYGTGDGQEIGLHAPAKAPRAQT